MKIKSALRQTLSAVGMVFVACAALIGVRYMTDASQSYRSHISDAAHKRIGEAYVHLGDNVPVKVAHPGQVIYVWNKYVKPATCHTTVTNLLIDKQKKVVHHYSMFANWFNEGTYEFNEIFHIPEWMPEGHYNLVKKSVSTCNGDVTYTTNFDIEFDIKK